ncbi:MAG: TIM barrel protein, partial [Gemmatimonadaceae bacterium]|nr:TIM barrel protein [Gemmatimonadaceae bacterium]
SAGVGSFAFGWAVGHAQPPFDEHALLAFARHHAVPVVQIADNLPVHTWPAERLERFTGAAQAAGIAIELGARGLTEARLAEYVSLCRPCGARLLRFVADAHPYEPSAEDVTAVIRNAAPALAAAGVTLALENHDRFPAAVLRRIIERAGTPHAGICLDTANSLGAGEGLQAVTDLLAPVTVNLHVRDVAITRLPHLMGFIVEGRPLGQGQLPLAETIDRVHHHGRCTSVILEAWTSPVETMEETVAREIASAHSSIEGLKALVGAMHPA